MSSQRSQSTEGPVVHVVEDDESSRTATARLLKTAGRAVRVYQSAAEFLEEMPAGPGCIVLDLRMPGPSGLDLQERLATAEAPMSVVFLTGHGDIPKSVRAMKNGAVDFLTKPVDPEVLLEAVGRALDKDAENRAIHERRQILRARYERLTPREREVLAHVISGQLNKQAAFDLGTTEHTIKVHRHRVMEKLEAGSMADLVRMAADLGIAPIGDGDDTKG
jgi:FixJ family two-component response regulator